MKLISQSSGHECKPAQYLAELACLRQGKKKGISTPPRFWNLPQWKKEYGRQVGLANGLLKLFSLESILSALNSKDGNWIFSLSFKGLIDIIKLHQDVIVANDKKAEAKPIPKYNTEIKTEVKQMKTGKTMIDRLKDLE